VIQQDPTLHKDDTRPLHPEAPDGTVVKIIGVGGVGSIVARYGAMFLASLQRNVRLVLIDGDEFEPTNATRMAFKMPGNKAEVVRDELLDYYEGSQLSILAIEEYVTPENVERLIHEGDIVIVAVDNNATRKIIDDFCAARRHDVCLISGGNDGVEERANGRRLRGTYGNCQIHLRDGGVEVTPSLSKFHPELATPGDHSPAESCLELVSSVPQIVFANLLAASCILQTLWLYLCGALHYQEVCFDLAKALMRPIAIVAEVDRRR
jgi:hypothetical protein